MRGTVNNILTHMMLPKSSVPLAPDYISTMISVRTEDQPEGHAYHMGSPCTVLCRCDGVMNVLITVVMLLCKCQIQTMLVENE